MRDTTNSISTNTTSDYRTLLLEQVPMMDVRAPIEFAKGAFPGTVNLPLMNDAEREAVGICYKQRGQQAAIALGHRLVSGPLKAERIAAWADFARQHPQGVLYCFRGGLRSKIAQQWLKDEAGIDYPRVTGGYQEMRRYLLRVLEDSARDGRFTVLGGLTGCGKTELLRQLPNAIDLEGHARHRGSSFGQHPTGQPAQIDFENSLAVDLLRKQAAGSTHLMVEDEGRHVGSCSIPLELYHRLRQVPLVWLEAPFEQRVERILQEYTVDQLAAFTALYGAQVGFARFAQQLLLSLDRIAKRLGGERYLHLSTAMAHALERHQQGDPSLHRVWISTLLQSYYDPMYAYQRQQREARIVFSGEATQVLAYFRSLCMDHGQSP